MSFPSVSLISALYETSIAPQFDLKQPKIKMICLTIEAIRDWDDSSSCQGQLTDAIPSTLVGSLSLPQSEIEPYLKIYRLELQKHEILYGKEGACFLHAIQAGNSDIFDVCLESALKSSLSLNSQGTLLRCSILQHFHSFTKTLLEAFPDAVTHISAEDSSTVLVACCTAGNVTAMKMVLDIAEKFHPGLITVPMRSGGTCAHIAAHNSDPEVMEHLIVKHSALLRSVDNNLAVPLHIAASNGHLETMKVILRVDRRGLSLVTKQGRTCLHLAAGYGHMEVVHFLIQESKALVDLVDRYDWSPYFHAVRRGYRDIGRVLLEADATMVYHPKSLLADVMQCSEVGIVLDILNADPTAFSTVGNERLCDFVADCLQVGMQKKKSSPTHNMSSYTPQEAQEVVRKIFTLNPALATYTTVNGRSLLFKAVRVGSIQCVQTLLDFYGLDVFRTMMHAVDVQGVSPYTLAQNCKHEEIVALFAEKGSC